MRSGHGGNYVKERAKFTSANFGWSVGHHTDMEVFWSSAHTPDFGASFEVAESFNYWSCSCVAVLAPSSGKANVGYPIEALHLGEL